MNIDKDGRRARSERNKQKIVDAMLALIKGGELEPTAEKVAQHAGISIRTVFRHFEDMETLFKAMTSQVKSEAQELFDIKITGDTWQQKLKTLIEKRAQIYETLMPARMAGNVMRHRSKFLIKENKMSEAQSRQNLINILPEEIVNDPAKFESLDAILSFEFWIRLRQVQNLDVERAINILHKTSKSIKAS